MKALRILGFANGSSCPIEGQYLKSFDFEARGGVGFGEFTNEPDAAMRFTDAAEALTFWRSISTTVPVRADGKPNRPLTACHAEIVEAP